MTSKYPPHDRATVLVFNKNKFCLIFRHKNGEDYYAIPGGKVEAGESSQQAAVREIQEELGFEIYNLKFVQTDSLDNGITNHIFTAQTDRLEFATEGPEKTKINNPENLFRPEWHTLESLQNIPTYPVFQGSSLKDIICNETN